MQTHNVVLQTFSQFAGKVVAKDIMVHAGRAAKITETRVVGNTMWLTFQYAGDQSSLSVPFGVTEAVDLVYFGVRK